MCYKKDNHKENEDWDKLLSQQPLEDLHLRTQEELKVNISMATLTKTAAHVVHSSLEKETTICLVRKSI